MMRKGSGSIVTKILRPWWRLTRGLTLGAQAVVIDPQDRILLIRHGYRRGWFLPGGGVERNETLEMALARELEEETGVRIKSRPEFHGLFANIEKFPGDHIGVFLVRHWEQPRQPKPNAEIMEQGFFARDDLPEGTDRGTQRRLDEIFDGLPKNDKW